VGCCLLSGCAEGDLPGFYWDVELAMVNDDCNAQPVGYGESLTYRMTIDEETQTATVAVGADVFASGPFEGCSFEYTSIPYTATRDEGDIRWSIAGTAAPQRGDGSCNNASDWEGTEVITVQASEDPDISPGCTYTLGVTGTYVGEVE
jgi:hypothetical protein